MMDPVLRQLQIIPVDICCNDGNNGMFLGECIALYFNECLLSTNTVKRDGTPIGVPVKFIDKNIMKIGRVKVIYLKRQTSGASWACDTILMQKEALARILNHLMKRGDWYFDEADTALFDKWERRDEIKVDDLGVNQEM